MENPIVKRNGEYWNRRFAAVEQLAHNENARTITELERHFINAQRELDQQINAWYGRFAENNQISLADARRWLNDRELAELKWDVNEYIKHAQAVGMNPGYIKQLENASARFHISRLEALKIQTDHTMTKLFSKYDDAATKHMKRAYSESYYRTCYEIQKGVGVGWDMAAINETALDKVISRPWTTDGNTFSDRIWSGKRTLVDRVHTELTQNMILGRGPDRAIKNIAAEMGVSRRQTGRLVMTESAYFHESADFAALKSLDVERYEIIATLDRKTSPICQDMDGKIFTMSQYQVGVTAPPFHPWCRTTKGPYFEDDDGERIARGADGKTYKIPGNMKYKEWKSVFVDGGEKTHLPPVIKSVTINMGLLGASLGDIHTAAMTNILENAPPDMQAVWNKYADRLRIENAHYKGGAHCMYTKGVSMDIDDVAKGEKTYTGELAKKPYYTAYHEFGHNISALIAQDKHGLNYSDIADLYESKVFTYGGGKGYTLTDMLKKEGNDYINAVWNRLKEEAKAEGLKASTVQKISAYNKLLEEIRSKPVVSCTDISDMWDGITKSKARAHYGHGASYWTKISVGTEAFAEMFSASVMNPESVAQIKHYFPDSYKIFEEIIQSLGVS